MTQDAQPALHEDEGSHRLFFALWPDATLRDDIARIALQLDHDHAPGGRRLHPSRYHLTLKFLGDFNPLHHATVVAATAAGKGVRAPSFDLRLDHAEMFSGSHVLWLGMHHIPPGLLALSTTLTSALAQAGLSAKAEAGFVPHVTLQRNLRRPITPVAVAPVHWQVRDFVLIDSAAGAYRIVEHWPLLR